MIGETVLLEGWLQKVRDEVTYYQGNYSSNYERLEGEEEVSCDSNPLIGLVTTSGDKIILAKELKEMLHDAEWKVKRNKFLSAGYFLYISAYGVIALLIILFAYLVFASIIICNCFFMFFKIAGG